jgi:ABC-2 type transport system ATP-binding protein
MSVTLEVKDLKKNYGSKQALRGVSFALRQSEIVAFLGPNGAGKSTTLKIIMGLRQLSSGTLKILGSHSHSFEIKNKMGYTSQDLSFPSHLRLIEVLRFVSAHFENPVSGLEMAERFQLGSLLKMFVGGLSGGEKRRLGLACALLGRPQILILDEPTTGLDVDSRHHLWREIQEFKAQGGTVLLSTHDLFEAGAVADRVLLIDQGLLLVDGSVEEIKSQIDFRKITYEIDGKEMTEMVQDSDVFVKKLAIEKPHFKSLKIYQVSLEEAFLKIKRSR